jgi:hypothetical protein
MNIYHMIKKILKYFSLCFVMFLSIMLILLHFSEGPIDRFLRSNKESPNQDFFKKTFLKIPDGKNKKALIIGAEIADYHGTYNFLKQKEYELIAYDTEFILWEVMFTKRENILKTPDLFPHVDVIMANGILPLFGREFDNNWKLINEALCENGYFIGTFWQNNPLPSYSSIRTHTEKEVRELFKAYTIIQFEEVQKENHKEFWIFAQKKHDKN